MNTALFKSIIIATIVLIFAAEASACRRCGHHGVGCHFAQPHVVHHTPPAQVTNFVFGSIFPGNYFPQQGGSVFGYGLSGYGPSGFSLQAQGNYVDPAMLFDRAGRFTELANQNAGAASQQFKELAAQALALNDQFDQRSKNAAIASVAITALQANTQPAPQAQQLKVSISSTGETTAEWSTPEGEFKPLGSPEITLTCAKCHDKPADSAPGGFRFNGKFSNMDHLDWAKEAVWSGKMPPESKLDRRGKSQVAEKLESLFK